MVDAFGDRQQSLLKILLKAKSGLSVDEIGARLGITRPAARQHVMVLERLGYVERGETAATGGRPSQIYRLSRKGHDLFPKQYSWFSEVLLEELKKQMGSAPLRELMGKLGAEVATQTAARVQGKTLPERVQETAQVMNDLAYQAEATFTGKEKPGAPPVIEATNCVYHALATQFPEVCQFDVALLGQLTDARVVHETCIVRGGGSCRFRFEKKKSE